MKPPSPCVKSPSLDSPKPVNIFYIWYGELCRRLNTTPLAIVKPAKPKNETVLDFVSDRIKAEEWGPILSALRQDTSLHVICVRSRVECKFLDDIDTERKAREMKRKGGSLYTAYILKCLMAALSYSIRRTQVLSCLELDGLPVTGEYLQTLLDALAKNKTVKVLSLKHCPLRDSGCEQVCQCLRYIPNVEVLNLTSCGLGSLSAQYIAKVIRSQQINRYCESWHSSLRYEDPDIGMMTGLKRITLNNNPNIGDEGLSHILNELDDDLWIKAIDMQRCNITEKIGTRLVDVIDYSKSLEVADFRNNEQLCMETVEKILDILKNKQRFGYECEYQWCVTTTTLPYANSLHETPSCTMTAETGNLQKSKSAPLKQMTKRSSSSTMPIRRTKTFVSLPNREQLSSKNLYDAKNEVMKLNTKLQQEISKRIQTEEENKELQKKLEAIQASINRGKYEAKEKKSDTASKSKELNRTKETLNIRFPSTTALNIPKAVEKKPDTKPKRVKTNNTNQKIPVVEHVQQKPSKVEFVFTIEDDKEVNVAQSLFENILYRNGSDDSDEVEEDVLKYFDAEGQVSIEKAEIVEDDVSVSNSNVSLLKFMEEIKGNAFEKIDRNMQNQSMENWDHNSSRNEFQKILAKVSPVR